MAKTRMPVPTLFTGVALPVVILCEGRVKLSLTACNAILAVLHALLAVVTFSVGDLGTVRPLYRFRLQRSVASTSWLTPDSVVPYGNFNLTGLTASFFLVSAFFHAGNATLWRAYYLKGVRFCFTPSRWVEYAFSAGIMAALIAFTTGVVALNLIVCVFALTSVTMFFGYLTELVARPSSRTNWSRPFHVRIQPHVLGYVPQIIVWYIIMSQFYISASDAAAAPGEARMPTFVYGIVWGEFFLFWSFGLVQLVATYMPPQFYPYGELSYQVLSLVSKGTLGVLLLANVLRP